MDDDDRKKTDDGSAQLDQVGLERTVRLRDALKKGSKRRGDEADSFRTRLGLTGGVELPLDRDNPEAWTRFMSESRAARDEYMGDTPKGRK